MSNADVILTVVTNLAVKLTFTAILLTPNHRTISTFALSNSEKMYF